MNVVLKYSIASVFSNAHIECWRLKKKKKNRAYRISSNLHTDLNLSNASCFTFFRVVILKFAIYTTAHCNYTSECYLSKVKTETKYQSIRAAFQLEFYCLRTLLLKSTPTKKCRYPVLMSLGIQKYIVLVARVKKKKMLKRRKKPIVCLHGFIVPKRFRWASIVTLVTKMIKNNTEEIFS